MELCNHQSIYDYVFHYMIASWSGVGVASGWAGEYILLHSVCVALPFVTGAAWMGHFILPASLPQQASQ